MKGRRKVDGCEFLICDCRCSLFVWCFRLRRAFFFPRIMFACGIRYLQRSPRAMSCRCDRWTQSRWIRSLHGLFVSGGLRIPGGLGAGNRMRLTRPRAARLAACPTLLAPLIGGLALAVRRLRQPRSGLARKPVYVKQVIDRVTRAI